MPSRLKDLRLETRFPYDDQDSRENYTPGHVSQPSLQYTGLAGRLPFRIVVMIVVDMISIGLTPSNRIMSILPSSAGADGGLSW